MAQRKLNIALIGYKFMGKAHTHAWRNAGYFFDLDAEPVLKVVCGRSEGPVREFAERWGWQEHATDWCEVVARDDIDIVDIATPTGSHHEIAIEAAKHGKHVFCEKPFALSVEQAEQMVEAVTANNVRHYVNHNYRRVPAVQYAKNMIEAGRIGRIYHWRGAYLQSWIMDPNFPLTWHLQKEHAKAGPHWDLNSHSVDLARFLVGDIKSAQAMMRTFIPQRPLPGEEAGTFKSGSSGGGPMGDVTVEDAAFMMVEFENGALGSFESSRFATGRKNHHTFEIYGEKGAITFDLERMNELEFYDNTLPTDEQGFRTILITEPDHPYIDAWWPPGHIIGYEHTFVHAMADFVNAVANDRPASPDFNDGLKCLKILQAGLDSAEGGRRVDL